MPKPNKQKKNEKGCWIAKEDRNGWALGWARNKETLWLNNFRFKTREDVERALKSGIVFVYLKDSKTVPGKK